MLFNSLQFLIFFPIVVILYWAFPHKLRWIWLLVTSYYFYMCWNAQYALLLATSTVITYISGYLIDRENTKDQSERRCIRRKKMWVACSFISNLAILFFFKYFSFAVENINAVLTAFHMQLVHPQFDVILPVGISFYTFQALSYTMDVYRQDLPAEKNIFKYALFVSFFPQLVAGPIERSKHLLTQIHARHFFKYDNLKSGLLLMLWGFFEKLVIADRVAVLVNQVFNHYQQYSGFSIAVAVILFAVQIYCDFSGYSDIAIGAARVMGFSLMQNFRRPYFSKSIAEFWRRWHISLSSWLRDYLYIPLGGNRKGKIRKYLNVMITFFVSGLWHGANWTYVIWGLLHGLYQVIGDVLRPVRDGITKVFHVDKNSFSNRLLRILFTFLLVDFAWIFFRASTITQAFGVIHQLVSGWNPWIFFDGTIFKLGLDCQDFLVMILGIVILFILSLLRRDHALYTGFQKQNLLFQWSVAFCALFFVLIFGIYGPGYSASQFIYFQF